MFSSSSYMIPTLIYLVSVRQASLLYFEHREGHVRSSWISVGMTSCASSVALCSYVVTPVQVHIAT
jgi:hypothetical protein